MGRHTRRDETGGVPPYPGIEKPTQLFLVDDTNLERLSTRPALGVYVRRMWDRRRFVWLDARSRAFKTDRDMILGRIWLVLSPLLDGLTYGFIFGFVLQTSRGIDNFVGYLLLGITFFGMMQGPLTGGIGLTRSFRGMLGAFDFPAASLVLSRALRGSIDSLIPGTVAIIVALAMQWQEPIKWTVILVAPLFLLIQFFGAGLMFISARVTAQIPDMKTVIQLAARAWFFISGVFFSVDRFVDQPELKLFMEENPAYRFLTAVRDVVMYGQSPSLSDWMILTVWGAGTFGFGFLFFWRGEGKYANVR